MLKILSTILVLSSLAAFAKESPNIIIIYADDVGYGDLGCYGAEAIDTANLDRMAAGGLRFTSAYATASTCTPSRYSLLTGEYPFRNTKAQILPGNAPLIIDSAKPTIASVLKKKGYATGLVGKWHLGLGNATETLNWNKLISPGPKELGFEYSFHMAATGDRVPTVYIENGRIVNLDPNDPIEVSYIEQVGNDPTGLSHPELLKVQADEQHAKTIVDETSRIGYMTGGNNARWTDEEMPDEFLGKAVSFIEENHEKPFFLYYAMHENHVPRLPHPRFKGSTSLGVRGDAVAQLDWSVGEILNTLDELNITENTLVIFSSDNGPVLFDGYSDGAREMNGNHKAAGPWHGGKYTVWEGGTRMPFIAMWKGTIEPGLSGALISQVDILASLAALTSGKIPSERASDSQNHIKALLGQSEEGRDHLVQQGINGMKAIRKGDWKYVPPGEVRNRIKIDVNVYDKIYEPGALFYLPEDPNERTDLSSRYPKIVDDMRVLLEAELTR
ncbi:MAG: arylsulfatase [Opitutaceae bacterium]|nr:arylsulfatase [Opitutaceae bacterium]